MNVPYITIIRPVCGDEQFLDLTLGSSFYIEHPSYEVIFCLESDADPALAIVQNAEADRSVRNRNAVPAKIVFPPSYTKARSPNHKLNNLLQGWDVARGQWVIMIDSNVMLPTDTIERLLTKWDDKVGLVCSPPIGELPYNFWAEVECAFLNTYEAKWQIIADIFGFGFCQGKVMCVRKDFINAYGGLIALDSEMAEDAAATKLVRRNNKRVTLASKLFPQVIGYRNFKEVWSRQVRWAALRRSSFSALYLLEIFTTMIPLATLAYFDWFMAALLYAVGMAGEFLLAKQLKWRTPKISAIVVRDLLLTPLWLTGLFTRKFAWKDHNYKV